jgi:hypothetical protein
MHDGWLDYSYCICVFDRLQMCDNHTLAIILLESHFLIGDVQVQHFTAISID